MTIAQRASALRRRLTLRAAEREARGGRIEAAFARLSKAAEASDIETRRAALQAAARLAAQHGRPGESAEHLRNLVRLDDADVGAWWALAQRLEEIGVYGEAAYAWRRIIALTGEDAALRLRIGGLADRAGDRNAQVEAWEEAARAAPDAPLPRQRLADLLLRDDPGRAAPHLERLAVIDPQEPAFRRAAEAAARAGRFGAEDAAAIEAAANALLARDADAIGARLWLGAFYEADRPAEALPHLRLAAQKLRGDATVWKRLAKVSAALGDDAAAAEAWKSASDAAPGDLEIARAAGTALEKLGRAGESMALMRRYTHVHPTETKLRRRLRGLANSQKATGLELEVLAELTALVDDPMEFRAPYAALLQSEGRVAEALPHLEAIALARPESAPDQQRYAEALSIVGEPAQALEAWRAMAALKPQDPRPHVRMAPVLDQLDRREEAAVHMRRAAELMGADRKAWARFGSRARSLGDVAGERAAHEALIELDPADPALRKRLIELLIAEQRPTKAEPHLEALVALTPEDDWAWETLSVARSATLKRVQAAKPNDAVTLRGLALARARAGDAAGAVATLRKLEALRPGDPEVQRQLAIVLTDQGDIDAAVAAWRKLLAVLPDDMDALRRAAAMLYSERRREEALPFLRAIVALDRADIRSWRRIASIVMDGDDIDAQVAAWKDVVAVDPDDLGAHEQLVDLLEGRDLQAAMPHMEAAARLTPDKVKPWKRLGKWLQDEGRIKDAIAAWSQSLAIAADDVETHRRLAQLHLLDGDYRSGLRRLNSFALITEEAPPALAGLVPEPSPLKDTPLVSAVILSLEGAELLESLLSSFQAYNRYPNVELIVIDHASTDDTAAVLDRWQDRLPIRRIMRDANYSYSASCNLGVREAKGDLVLLLNNDVVFREDVLTGMVRYLTPDVGIVGLKQYNSAPLPEEVLRPYHIGVRWVWDGHWFRPRHAIPTASDQLLSLRPAYFPAVTASVMLCRKADYLAVGGLDEAFIYGHEDLDFCCKMRMDGGKAIVSLNNHSAFHPKNSTRRGADAETRARQGKANEALFRERWGDRIADEYRGRVFTDDGSYRGRAPAVAFGLPIDADDALLARAYAVGEAMVARFGWKVRYLLAEEPGWTNGDGVDAVLGMGDFPLEAVKTREPVVVRLAVADEGGVAEAVAERLRAALEAGVARPGA